MTHSRTSLPISGCFPETADEWKAFTCLPGIAGMAGIPKKYLASTTLKAVDESVRKIVLEYLMHIDKARETGKGIMLYGGQSCGKTSILALVAEAWGRRFGTQKKQSDFNPYYVQTMRYVHHADFCREYNIYPEESRKADWREVLNRMQKADLLLYDDLGAGAITSTGSTNLLSVLEYRITSGLVTCFAMNGSLDDLAASSDGNLKRLAVKVKDALMQPIVIGDNDRREFTPWQEIGH